MPVIRSASVLTISGRTILATMVLAVVVGVGCGGDGKTASEAASTSTTVAAQGLLAGEEVSKAVPGHLRLSASGAVSIDYDEDVELRIVVIDNEEVTPIKFVSVGIEKLLPLPSGDAFRVAFDLTGGYEGAGAYELPAIGEVGHPGENLDPDNPDANAAGRGLSKPYLTYSPDGLIDENPAAAATAVSFENPLRACTLEITADDASEGRLECPEVADATSATVAFTMEWSRV